MADVFCWNPECRWDGPDNELGIRFYDRPFSPPGNTSCCPKCFGPIYTEAETERAAIKQYCGNKTRPEAEEEAERKVEGQP